MARASDANMGQRRAPSGGRSGRPSKERQRRQVRYACRPSVCLGPDDVSRSLAGVACGRARGVVGARQVECRECRNSPCRSARRASKLPPERRARGPCARSRPDEALGRRPHLLFLAARECPSSETPAHMPHCRACGMATASVKHGSRAARSSVKSHTARKGTSTRYVSFGFHRAALKAERRRQSVEGQSVLWVESEQGHGGQRATRHGQRRRVGPRQRGTLSSPCSSRRPWPRHPRCRRPCRRHPRAASRACPPAPPCTRGSSP